MQALGIELWAVVWNVVEFGVSVVQEEGELPELYQYLDGIS